jgi:integrase
MPYQYVREPLKAEEADRLSHACQDTKEKLIIWTLLDTGLRVSELCSLSPENILWQQRSLRISGKGGPYGKKSKKRVVPMSKRVQALLEPYFALHDKWFAGERQVQKNRQEDCQPGADQHSCYAACSTPHLCNIGPAEGDFSCRRAENARPRPARNYGDLPQSHREPRHRGIPE